jgi:hypothetical protein
VSDNTGVLYLVWGNGVEGVLKRAQASLKHFHPELPVHVERLPDGSGLLDKAKMMDMTPFEETIFLDADTMVMGRLDFAIEQARRVGLACSICECPWARRYGGIEGEMIEYNTGVLFFTKKARPVFDRWAECAADIDSSIEFKRNGEMVVMPSNDQAGFAQAIHDTGFVPFVLPGNWNFRAEWMKSFFGPLKVWHDYRQVPDALIEWNARQSSDGAVIDYVEIG